MRQSPDPLARMHTMTKRQGKSGTIDVKALLAEDEEFLRALVRTALQEVLEAEMTEVLGAEKGERAAGRQGYRSGYYGRTLITRVGKLELRVPQDRAGRFSIELAGFSAGAQSPWSAWRRVCRHRRSCRPQSGAARGAGRGSLSALLCAFPAQRARPRAAQDRRRLPAGAALAVRSARS